MRKKLVALLLTAITTTAVIFLLPNFSVQVGEQTYDWKGLSFGLPANLTNFQLGDPFQSWTQTKLVANLDQTLDNGLKQEQLVRDAALVNSRLQAAGFVDVLVAAEVTGDEYALVIKYPGRYLSDEAEVLSQLAAAPGVIKFWNHDPSATEDKLINNFLLAQQLPEYKPVLSSVSTADLESIAVETRSNLTDGEGNLLSGLIWRLRFKQSAAERAVSTVVSGGDFPAILAIDEQPAFVLRLFTSETDIIAIPILSGEASYLRLLSTYLTVAGGTFGSYGAATVTTLPADLGIDYLWLAAGVMCLVSVAIALVLWRKMGKLGWRAALATGLVLVWGLTLLKLGGAELSYLFIIAAVISLGLNLVIYINLQREELLKPTFIRNAGVAVFIGVWLVVSLGLVPIQAIYFVNLVGLWALFTGLGVVINWEWLNEDGKNN